MRFLHGHLIHLPFPQQQGDVAAFTTGIARVDDQVHHRPFQAVQVDLDQRLGDFRVVGQRDAGARGLLQQRQQLVHHPRHVHQLRAIGVVAGEPQQALRHRRTLLHRPVCHLQQAGIALHQLPVRAYHLDGRASHVQHVVEVVHRAGQQLPDRVALLRLRGHGLGHALGDPGDVQLALQFRAALLGVGQLRVELVGEHRSHHRRGVFAQRRGQGAQRRLGPVPGGDVTVDREQPAHLALRVAQRTGGNQPETVLAGGREALRLELAALAARGSGQSVGHLVVFLLRPQRRPLRADHMLGILRRHPGQPVGVDEPDRAVQ